MFWVPFWQNVGSTARLHTAQLREDSQLLK